MHSQISGEQHAVYLNLYLNTPLFSLSLNVIHKKGEVSLERWGVTKTHWVTSKESQRSHPKETSLLYFHSRKAKSRPSWLNVLKARWRSRVIWKKDKEFLPEIYYLKTWKKTICPFSPQLAVEYNQADLLLVAALLHCMCAAPKST